MGGAVDREVKHGRHLEETLNVALVGDWLTTIWGASWWDYSALHKIASPRCLVADTNAREEEVFGVCLPLQVLLWSFHTDTGLPVVRWPASCSLDSAAACFGRRKGGDGAKCTTADPQQDSYPAQTQCELDGEHHALIDISNAVTCHIFRLLSLRTTVERRLRSLNSQPETCHPTAPAQRLWAQAKPRRKRSIL